MKDSFKFDLSIDELIELNKYVLGSYSGAKKQLLDSAVSSWHYYEDNTDKISSIFKGLVKNHPFSDGNKRTAVFVLLYLSKENKLRIVNDTKLEDLVIEIASSNFSVEEISKLIFV